jgi:hypothetical protein
MAARAKVLEQLNREREMNGVLKKKLEEDELNFTNMFSDIKKEASANMLKQQDEFNQLLNKFKKCELEKLNCSSSLRPSTSVTVTPTKPTSTVIIGTVGPYNGYKMS